MKKTVKIEGLDCPNCAKTLEGELAKIEGIKNVHIEFVKSTLSFESENVDETMQKVTKLTKELEPNAKIEDFAQKSEKKDEKFDKMLILDVSFLLLGIAIGFVIFFVKMPTWCFWTLYVISALLLGYKTYLKAIRLLFKGIINENLLITISVVGASIVSENMEGLMVIALYSIGKIFENLAVKKSRKSIEKLAKLQPEYANLVLKNGSTEKVLPNTVKVGSKILVRAGEKVALDGVIVEGSALADMQNLTGESVPVQLKKGDKILSGTIILDAVVVVKTTSLYENSAISKIMNLVENATENKSKTETFISKITKWYTLGIILLAVSVWGIVWAVTKNFDTAIYRGLIFLVISCPCAFAISVPLSYFSGLGNASKNGILIKGSNYLDACANLDLIAFDKTGTLTTGKFEVEKVESLDKTKTEKDILFLAAVGEQYSIHPLANAIVAANKKRLPRLENFKEEAGLGVKFSFGEKDYFVGRKTKNLSTTTVEVFENNKKIGEIHLADTLKHTAIETCQDLKKLGIKTVMLSGDNPAIVEKVANSVGVDEAVGKLLPEDKYAFLESHQKEKMKVAYVGDGINDAPSLALANVGISMGINGAPASIEASDVVLVDDNPHKIISAIKISKFTKRIVLENIGVSAVVKLVFLALGSFGVTGMLVAVFADVGVTLLAILNSIRALRYNPTKNKKCKVCETKKV